MEQFVVPDDGLVVTTKDGRPIVELSIQPEGNILRLFDAEGDPKIALATHGDTGLIILGDPDKTGVAISTGGDVSEVSIVSSGKNVSMAVSESHSEIKLVNADGAMTGKLFVDKDGGQLGLADHAGNLLISAGAEERGGVLHVMNTNADTVAVVESKDNSGNITLLDAAKNIRIMIGHKDDGNIYLVDHTGHVTWTTASDD